jgi:small-conductance mechanosensitive channel
VCFTGLLVLWGRAWFKATRVILRALEAERDRYHLFQPRTIPFFEMTIKLLLVGVLTYLMFLVWDIDATAWVASAGIIGIVVGFAARDTLANLISGVSIVADAPYKIGDYIVLDTGERGLVTHLGIRSTRILTRDDIEVSIPNAVIGSTKVINESGGPRVRHRIRIPVGVAYSSDMRKVIEVLEGIANAHETVADDPAPRVRVRGFGDNSINVELLVWIRRPAERGQTVHELALEIIEQFRAANISIPFPQRDLHWVNAATGDGALPLKP